MEVKLDMREFNQAIKDYAEAGHKTFAYAANKAMKDAALRAVKYVPEANIKQLDMWRALARRDPSGLIAPFVAYLLRRKKGGAGPQLATGGKTPRRKYYRVKRFAGQFYTREQAREFGMKVFAARRRAVSFLRAFFVAVGRRFAAASIAGGERGKAKNVPQIKTEVRIATTQNPNAALAAAYDYKRRGGKPAAASNMLYRAMQSGMDEKVKDMKEYIERKLAEKARQISVG